MLDTQQVKRESVLTLLISVCLMSAFDVHSPVYLKFSLFSFCSFSPFVVLLFTIVKRVLVAACGFLSNEFRFAG